MLFGQNLRSLHVSEIGKQLEMGLTGIGNPELSCCRTSCWGNSQSYNTEYRYHFDMFPCDYHKCSLRDIGPEGVKLRTISFQQLRSILGKCN
jgi:hypothetical protein